MKKLTLLLSIPLAFSCSLAANAAELPPFPIPQPLDKVSYQVTVEKWATSNTANVTINLDAALDKVGLADVNSHVLDTLRKMSADAKWHVTQFNRSQDKSGLEVIHVEAEARLPQDALAGLRDKAKSISKAGETYTVGDIDFTPELAEMEKAHAEARSAIYDQVKQEITRLNQAYPEQHYFLNQLDFMPSQVVPTPAPFFKGAGAGNVMVASLAAPAPNNIPINAKVTEVAQVVIATQNPQQPANK